MRSPGVNVAFEVYILVIWYIFMLCDHPFINIYQRQYLPVFVNLELIFNLYLSKKLPVLNFGHPGHGHVNLAPCLPWDQVLVTGQQSPTGRGRGRRQGWSYHPVPETNWSRAEKPLPRSTSTSERRSSKCLTDPWGLQQCFYLLHNLVEGGSERGRGVPGPDY